MSLWLAFGLLLSVVIRRAATAALVGFGVWLLVAIFGQLIVGLIAGVVAPVASADRDRPGALADRAVRDHPPAPAADPLPGGVAGPPEPVA